MPPAQAPIKATTQDHLEIEDIRDDLVVLKDGGCCLILTTTAVNFGLLSEAEQDATIYAYAGFLNSLSFPIQISIRSQRKDISFYLQILKNAEITQTHPLLKDEIRKYRAFVEKIVMENEVLDKKFYITIPFSYVELGIGSSVNQSFKTKKKLPLSMEIILEKAKTVLYPKRDHLIGQFGRIGLKARQLNSQELLDLFYHIYNPDAIGQKMDVARNYNASLVAASVQNEIAPLPASLKSNIVAPPVTKTANLPQIENPNIQTMVKKNDDSLK